MTVTIDRTQPAAAATSSADAALPPEDVIIVHVAHSLGDGTAVLEAAAGKWVVSDEAAKYLSYLVAVTTNNDVVGVFDIVGYQAGIEHTKNGAQRVRFDLVPSDRTVITPIKGSVQGNRRAYPHDLISGQHQPRAVDAAASSGPTMPADHGPAVCPDCQLAHAGPDCW